jgi:hypothetical protein
VLRGEIDPSGTEDAVRGINDMAGEGGVVLEMGGRTGMTRQAWVSWSAWQSEAPSAIADPAPVVARLLALSGVDQVVLTFPTVKEATVS